MYYHIKLENKNKEKVYFYDRDVTFAKDVSEQFYSNDDIVCEGHIILHIEKKKCIIISTPYTAEMEVQVLNNKYPDILVITRDSLFNEYKNIIDEL